MVAAAFWFLVVWFTNLNGAIARSRGLYVTRQNLRVDNALEFIPDTSSAIMCALQCYHGDTCLTAAWSEGKITRTSLKRIT